MKATTIIVLFLFFAVSVHAANPSGAWHGYGEGWPYTYLKIELNGGAVLAFFNPDKAKDSLNPLIFRAPSGALRWVDGAYLVKFCSNDCEQLYGTLVFSMPGAPTEPNGGVIGNFFRYSNWREKGAEYLQSFPIQLSVKGQSPSEAFSALEKNIANK